MPRYGSTAQKSVERSMHKRKHGQLKSGSGQKVKSRKQAIAIGLSEARKKGAKVPSRSSSRHGRSSSSGSSRGRRTSSHRRTSRSRSS